MDLDYDLDLQKVAGEIKQIANARHEVQKDKPVKVCLQLPDGLKANAPEIVDNLEKLSGVQTEIILWAGSNFGGCDYPWYLKDLGFDLLVNFGHAVFKKWPDKQ